MKLGDIVADAHDKLIMGIDILVGTVRHSGSSMWAIGLFIISLVTKLVTLLMVLTASFLVKITGLFTVFDGVVGGVEDGIADGASSVAAFSDGLQFANSVFPLSEWIEFSVFCIYLLVHLFILRAIWKVMSLVRGGG